MTLSMLGLAGIPATAGFIGKFYLIDAAVSGGYTWLGVVIVIGSMISLGYYLPVIAAMWMRRGAADAERRPRPAHRPRPRPDAAEGALPALAGGSPELDEQAPASAAPRRAGGRSGPAADRPPARGRPRRDRSQARRRCSSASSPQPLFDLVHGVGSALGLL